jgi:hypothetical protein
VLIAGGGTRVAIRAQRHATNSSNAPNPQQQAVHLHSLHGCFSRYVAPSWRARVKFATHGERRQRHRSLFLQLHVAILTYTRSSVAFLDDKFFAYTDWDGQHVS